LLTDVTVDAAGAQMGGAARFLAELRAYLAGSGRTDVTVIGLRRQVCPAWLVRRELAVSGGRWVALNNVGFVRPGGERWTLLRNALHFLTEAERARLAGSLRAGIRAEAAAVRLAARRSHVLVAPSSAMADRVAAALPGLRGRLVVRPHPVSPRSLPRLPREQAILCPVLFAPYKRMPARLGALLDALTALGGPARDVQLWVTATAGEAGPALAHDPRVRLVGRRSHLELRELQARSRAIYFPTGLESFGYPLAEARVGGRPVIAADSAQNREIAGAALCGFTPGDPASLRCAAEQALTTEVAPEPAAFDPAAYFGWLLGGPA
jgi:glycosyltransferase involved in cell wall biosynthesis